MDVCLDDNTHLSTKAPTPAQDQPGGRRESMTVGAKILRSGTFYGDPVLEGALCALSPMEPYVRVHITAVPQVRESHNLVAALQTSSTGSALSLDWDSLGQSGAVMQDEDDRLLSGVSFYGTAHRIPV